MQVYLHSLSCCMPYFTVFKFFFFLLVYSEMQCITVKHESLQGIGFAKCLGTKPRIQEFQSGSFCYLYSDALN